jgi:hypothetical protein
VNGTNTLHVYSPEIIGSHMLNVEIVKWLSVQLVDNNIYTPAHKNTSSIQSIPTVCTCEPAFLQLYRYNVYFKNLKGI